MPSPVSQNNLTLHNCSKQLQFAGSSASEQLSFKRNANVSESFETFIRNKTDALDNPIWKKYISLGKTWRIKLSKNYYEGCPAILRPILKSKTQKLNDDPILVKRGIYASSQGGYNTFTHHLILPQLKEYREKEQQKPSYKEIEQESYDDILTHEAVHALDVRLGKTPFSTAIQSISFLSGLIASGIWLTGGLLTGRIAKQLKNILNQNTSKTLLFKNPFLSNVLKAFLRTSVIISSFLKWSMMLIGALFFYRDVRSYQAFSHHPDFEKAVKSDKENILENIPDEYKGTKLFKHLVNYFNKPYEALAHSVTALYMDPKDKRTIGMKKMYPNTTEYVKKHILNQMINN